MNTYLSIDLDFWLADPGDSLPIKTLFQLLGALKNIECPKVIVKDHDELVPFIDESTPSKIVHIDYHQDIAWPTPHDRGPLELNCGTFFWFIQNKENIEFTWYYPDTKCVQAPWYAGLCMDMYYKPFSKRNFIFKNQTKRVGLPPLKTLKDVNSIGIAISKEYCAQLTENYVDSLVKSIIKRYNFSFID